MTCTRCGLFPKTGPFCLPCRTIQRLREVVEGGLILKAQEGEAVRVLREAAGGLLDLAEEAAPVLAAERRAANPPGLPDEPRNYSTLEPLPSLRPAEPVSGAKPAPTDSGVKVENEAEEAKESVAEIVGDGQDDGAKEASTSAQEAVGEEKAVVEKEEVKKKKKRKHKTAAGSSGGDKKRKKRVRERQEKAEEEKVIDEPIEDKPASGEADWSGLVDSNPRFLGLSPVPKGSVAAHLARLPVPPPAPERRGPVEPDHPPPHLRGSSSRGQRRSPRRSPSPPIYRRPRGTKGVKHRERGYYWGR